MSGTKDLDSQIERLFKMEQLTETEVRDICVKIREVL